MSEWYSLLPVAEQALLIIAMVSTTIFLIQLGASLLGLGGHDLDLDASADGGAAGFGDIFSIRNGVAFLMGLSWGGLMAHDWGITNQFLVFLVGFFVGSFFVAANLLLLLGFSRLRHKGNVDLENAIGVTGMVSLRVPAARTGRGKVTISIQGRLKEYHAVTDGAAIARNQSVLVVDLSGSQLVVSLPER